VTRLSILAAAVFALALPSQALAQADTARLTLAVTGGATTGDRQGGAIGGEAAIRVTRMLDIVIGGSRLSDITPDDLVSGATTVAAAVAATAEVHQRANVFDAGVRLRIPTGMWLQPYALIGGGTARVTTDTVFRKGGAEVDPGNIGIQLAGDLDHQATKASLLLGAGVDLALGRHGVIDAGIRFNRLFANTTDVPGDIDRNVLRFQVGAGIRF
jgi:opacity protein-like surface antigen